MRNNSLMTETPVDAMPELYRQLFPLYVALNSLFSELDIDNIVDAADDVSAGILFVPVGGIYRTGSILKIRVS